MEPTLELAAAAAALIGRVAALVQEQDLDRPTPCTQWDVRALLTHVLAQNAAFTAAAGGQPAQARGGSWGSRVSGSADQVTEAFRAAHASGRERVELAEFGRSFRLRTALEMHVIDTVAHAWDLSVSVGAPASIDDDLAMATLQLADRLVPEDPAVRGEGRPFGAALDLGAAVPVCDRLLASLGRDPGWAPPTSATG